MLRIRLRSLWIGGWIALLLFSGNGAAQRPGDLVITPGVRQLFLDDFLLGSLYRVRRKVHQPHRYEGSPVVRADQPWEIRPGRYAAPGTTPVESRTIQVTSAPSWDPGEKVWKMWYHGGPGKTAFARSREGIVWEKPALGVKEFRGSRENNLVAVRGEPDALVQHVILDPHGTGERRYKGLLGPRDRRPIVSADGYVFTRLDVPPIPSQDTSQLTYDELGKQFILTVKHRGPFGRSVYLTLSRDFEQWTDPQLIFHADALDQKLGEQRIRDHLVDPRLYTPQFNQPENYNAEIYKMPIFPYEGVYIGLPNYFESSGITPPHHNNQDGVNSAKLATSRDLLNWVPVGTRESFLPVSRLGEGRIDTAQVLPVSRPIVKGDELWFYYSGVDVRYPANGAFQAAIHLARLRRDGFVSFWADEKGGFVETGTLKFGGTQLWVNADASRGEIRVEVRNPRGRKALDGWARLDSIPVTTDQLKVRMEWEGKDSLESLSGQRVRFRFHLKNAHVYSFWFE